MRHYLRRGAVEGEQSQERKGERRLEKENRKIKKGLKETRLCGHDLHWDLNLSFSHLAPVLKPQCTVLF